MGRYFEIDILFSEVGNMTITRILAVVVMGLGVGLGVSVRAADSTDAPPTTAPARRPQRGPAAPAGLGQAMKEMEKLFKALKADGGDSTKYDQNLQNIEMMERDAAISKLSLPPMLRNVSGEEKAKQAEVYRQDMVELMKSLMAVEEAIVAKNPGDVTKALDGVDAVMKKGHEAFLPKEN